MDLVLEVWNDPMGQQGFIVATALWIFFFCAFRVVPLVAETVPKVVGYFVCGVVKIVLELIRSHKKEAP